MKKIIFILSMLIMSSPLIANANKGREIMKRVDDMAVFEKMKSNLILDIFSSSGSKLYSKKFRMGMYTLNFTDTVKRITKSINYFYSPSDDKGNATLNIDYKKKDDDRWLYLKGLRKPKRIAGSDRGSDFMGSDFSQEDVKKPNFDDYKYKFLKEEGVSYKVRKFMSYVVECTPKNSKIKNDIGYGKIIRWIEKNTLLNMKSLFYDTNMTKIKKLTMISFFKGKNKVGQKVYMIKKMKMENLRKGTSSVVSFKKINTEAKARLRTDIFSVRYLTQKWW